MPQDFWDSLPDAQPATPQTSTGMSGNNFWDSLPDADVQESASKKMSDMGALNAASDSAVDSATFGLDKPVTSAGIAGIEYAKNALTGAPHQDYGDIYNNVMKWQKDQDKSEQEKHPIASDIGTVAGFAGGMAPAKAIGVAATGLDALKAAAKTNAAIGGAVGGINGIGYSQGNIGDRLESGAEGAALGAGAGAIMPAALQGIGKIAGKFVSPILSRFTVPTEDQAIQKMAGNITRDNINPADLTTQLAGMGKEGTIADIGGANTQGLGRTIVGLPGQGKEAATDFLNQRQAGQGSRIADSLNSNLGINSNYYDAEAASLAQQKKAVPLYQEAFQANQSVSSPAISRILDTPAGQSALKKAATFMQNDMSLMGVPDPELAEQAKLVGTYQPGGIASGLKLRTLDYVKQALDDQIGGLYRTGANKEANSINSLKNNLLTALDNSDQATTGGKYAQARAIWAGEARSQEALDMGRSFINEDATITNRNLNALPQGEKEMFRIGAAQALRDKVANTPYSADAGKNIFGDPAELYGSQAKRERVQALFPDQVSFNNFENQMKNEATMYQTRANVTQGSRTAPMAAEMADAGGVDMGHIIEAAKGNVGGGLIKMGINAANKLFDKYQFPEEVRNSIAQKMFTTDPVENAKTIASIQNALQPKPTRMTNRAAFLAGQSGKAAGKSVNAQ